MVSVTLDMRQLLAIWKIEAASFCLQDVVETDKRLYTAPV